MVRRVDEEQFRDFVLGQAASLRLLALAVTGDRHLAEDLVAGTLERTYQFWPRVSAADHPGAYVRTMLLRLHASERRRGWFRHERPTDAPAAGASASRVTGFVSAPDQGVVERLDLLAALGGLTAKQRAVVVLRYVEDRQVEEVADIMRISVGTVKRQAHDALRRLRGTLTPWGRPGDEPGEVQQLDVKEAGHA